MRKKTGVKICGVIFAVAVIFCIVIGRITAGSYIDNVELDRYLSNQDVTIAYCGMGYDPLTNRGYMDNDEIQSVDDLTAKDVVIVKARLNGEFQRKLYYECILSKIDIVECYEGNLKEGDSISIFEPADCSFVDQILCIDGYSMMQPDKEYILFLKTLQNTYMHRVLHYIANTRLTVISPNFSRMKSWKNRKVCTYIRKSKIRKFIYMRNKNITNT